MTSAIDATKPIAGTPTTESVRANFLAAKNEIEALQSFDSALMHPLVPFVRRGAASMHIAGDIAGTALTTLALTALRCYLIPFTVGKALPVSQLMASVTTLLAGTGSLGIYANDPTGDIDNPGSKLFEGSTTIDTTTTGDKYVGCSYTLQPGVLYWAALVCSAACTVRALAVASQHSGMGRAAAATASISHLYVALGSISLPATMPPGTQGTGICPAIYLYGG